MSVPSGFILVELVRLYAPRYKAPAKPVIEASPFVATPMFKVLEFVVVDRRS